MEANWCDLPIILCPHCDISFQMDDYGNVSIGDDTDCPKCEKTIHFIYVETILSVKVATKPE